MNKLWSNQPDERPDAERPWLRPGMSLKVCCIVPIAVMCWLCSCCSLRYLLTLADLLPHLNVRTCGLLQVLLGGGDQNVLKVVTYNEKGGRKVVLDLEALMAVA